MMITGHGAWADAQEFAAVVQGYRSTTMWLALFVSCSGINSKCSGVAFVIELLFLQLLTYGKDPCCRCAVVPSAASCSSKTGTGSAIDRYPRSPRTFLSPRVRKIFLEFIATHRRSQGYDL